MCLHLRVSRKRGKHRFAKPLAQVHVPGRFVPELTLFRRTQRGTACLSRLSRGALYLSGMLLHTSKSRARTRSREVSEGNRRGENVCGGTLDSVWSNEEFFIGALVKFVYQSSIRVNATASTRLPTFGPERCILKAILQSYGELERAERGDVGAVENRKCRFVGVGFGKRFCY